MAFVSYEDWIKCIIFFNLTHYLAEKYWVKFKNNTNSMWYVSNTNCKQYESQVTMADIALFLNP